MSIITPTSVMATTTTTTMMIIIIGMTGIQAAFGVRNFTTVRKSEVGKTRKEKAGRTSRPVMTNTAREMRWSGPAIDGTARPAMQRKLLRKQALEFRARELDANYDGR